MNQWIYQFGNGAAKTPVNAFELLGEKGVNLVQMSNLDLPVPPGFIITTEAYRHYFTQERTLTAKLRSKIKSALKLLEEATHCQFGDAQMPLLLSVRPSLCAALPGMADTILNLGMNDGVANRFTQSVAPDFAFNVYRLFIEKYSDVVFHFDHHIFEEIWDQYSGAQNQAQGDKYSAHDGVRYRQFVEEELDVRFPQAPYEQFWACIEALFQAWASPAMTTHRLVNQIPEEQGMALVVQAMVFGNKDSRSATGVAVTRHPKTGRKSLRGEYYIYSQGKNVLSDLYAAGPLSEELRIETGAKSPALEAAMPDIFSQLVKACRQLEQHYQAIQDIEFTVEKGKLWFLQSRAVKTTPAAQLRFAVDLVDEGLIRREDAILHVDPAILDQFLHPSVDPDSAKYCLAQGVSASPGAASGEIVFTVRDVLDRAAQGRKAILVRQETHPSDIQGMYSAAGILTSRGGVTSHAAVIARGMGKPCVSGARQLRIDAQKGCLIVADKIFHEGDWLTIDGNSGQVLEGAVALQQPIIPEALTQLMQWADDVRKLRVRCNADTASEAQMALALGAEGIGLCRTEHMFLESDRIMAMREMILSADEAERRIALEKLLPMQRADFIELLSVMKTLPVTIRLLDLPLHEFLPRSDSDLAKTANALNLSVDAVRKRIHALREFNPMLGHRGCRLSVSFPEIADMQARAIFEAYIAVMQKNNQASQLEIMVPMVCTKEELDLVKARIDRAACCLETNTGMKISYDVGIMVEVPRAALQAGQIAKSASFLSFGTNDLTQTTFGISRDDAAVFLDHYLREHILLYDPFVHLDEEGVGCIMEIAIEHSKITKPNIKLGICGEHGGDPQSIQSFHNMGLHYISCSPFRVPIARLAAAQAVLR